MTLRDYVLEKPVRAAVVLMAVIVTIEVTIMLYAAYSPRLTFGGALEYWSFLTALGIALIIVIAMNTGDT